MTKNPKSKQTSKEPEIQMEVSSSSASEEPMEEEEQSQSQSQSQSQVEEEEEEEQVEEEENGQEEEEEEEEKNGQEEEEEEEEEGKSSNNSNEESMEEEEEEEEQKPEEEVKLIKKKGLSKNIKNTTKKPNVVSSECRFPANRIKTIIKNEGFDFRITQEAVFLINKATEQFLEQFTEDAHANVIKDRKKALAYKHVSSVVTKTKRYDFLSDFVPEKIKAEDASSERKLAET